MTPARLAAILAATLAAAVLVAGLIIGFLPVTVDVGGCGAPFHPGNPYLVPRGCADILAGRKTVGVVMVAASAVALFVALVVAARPTSQPPAGTPREG